MKEDFAFITIIITVYHFWMYSHLVSFKCKSGHWTAHVVTHGSLTMMIHSGIGRENIRAPLLSLRENNRFDLCLFSWKHRTQQNKKPWDFLFFFSKTKVATVLCLLCTLLSLSFSFAARREEQELRSIICSARSRGNERLGSPRQMTLKQRATWRRLLQWGEMLFAANLHQMRYPPGAGHVCRH